MNPISLLKKDLFKDLSFLIGGTFIAQLIPILLQPILKRIFTVEEFGVFDIYFRSVSILAVLFSLKYEGAIVLCREKSDSATVYIGVIILGFLSFLMTELVLILFGVFNITLLNVPEKYSLVIYIIPLSALFFTINNATQLIFIRHRRFMASSSQKIFRRSSEGIIQTGSGILGFFWGLPLGEALGSLSASAIGVLRLRRVIRDTLPSNLVASLRKNARQFADFPRYALGSNLLNTIVLSALTFQIFAKFSIEEVGFAELSQRMLTIPFALIGASLGQVVLQRFSAAFNKQNSVRKLFYGILAFSTILAMPFFVIIYFWGPEIFGWVFGKEWITSGIYAKKLILSTCIFFIVSPLGQVLIGLQKIKLNSIWQLMKFVAIGSLFFLPFPTIESYLSFYNIILIIVYLIYLIIIFLSVENYQKRKVNEVEY